MRIKNIIHEDFVNYKKASMFINMGTCDFKCARDGGFDKSVCQNSTLAHTPDIDISDNTIIQWYIENPITEAIVVGGMEPFTYWEDLKIFIKSFREKSSDEIIIYTGYYPHEILEQLLELTKYENIILKFGRFILNAEKKFDNVLGVELASNNQYAYHLNQGREDTVNALIENEGYCPCMIAMTEDTKCSCLAFRTKDSGTCHCGIFSK